MANRILLTLTLAIVSVPALAQGIQGVYQIHEINSGVYVAQPRFGGANSTIIINDDHVVLVDPSSSPANGHALAAEIRSVTDKPLRFVVNTHWHGDHHGGNRGLAESFPGPVTFISHPLTREDIVTEATAELRQFGSFYLRSADTAAEYLEAGIGDNDVPLSEPQPNTAAAPFPMPEEQEEEQPRRGTRVKIRKRGHSWEAIYWGVEPSGAVLAHNTCGSWRCVSSRR